MTSYHMNNQNINFINKNLRKNISLTPTIYRDKYNYGEKVREKKNYTLYVSGSGYSKPFFEQEGKGKTQFKLVKNKNNNQKNFINIKNEYNNLYIPKNKQILSSSNNYGFKETKHLKEESPNTNINMQENYISKNQNVKNNSGMKQSLKIKKTENYFYKGENIKREIINNIQLNQNKSSDNIIPMNKQTIYKESFGPRRFRELVLERIENDNYYIKTENNNKYSERKEKMKPIKSYNTPCYNYRQNLGVYIRKNIKKENNYQNVPNTALNYINEEDNDVNKQYDNLRNRKMNEYNNFSEMDDKDDYENQNRIDINYRNNERKRRFENRKFNQYLDFDDINGIKNIECPLHGKISIIIHKKPYDNN